MRTVAILSSISSTCNLPTGFRAEMYIFGGEEKGTKYSKPTLFTGIMFLRIPQVVEL
jgi:hypothetical protein